MRPSLSLEEVPTSPSLTHVTHEGQRNSSLRDCPQAASSAHSASRSEPQHSASKRSPTLGSVGRALTPIGSFSAAQPARTIAQGARRAVRRSIRIRNPPPPWGTRRHRHPPGTSRQCSSSRSPCQSPPMPRSIAATESEGPVLLRNDRISPGRLRHLCRSRPGHRRPERQFAEIPVSHGVRRRTSAAPCPLSPELGRPTLPPCNESLTPLRKDGSGCASC